MHLEILRGESGEWYVKLVAGNGETMMHSEAYDNKQNAERAAETIAGITGLLIATVAGDDD